MTRAAQVEASISRDFVAGDAEIIELDGEFDASNSAQLERQLSTAVAAEPTAVLVDLRGVRFLYLAALKTLVRGSTPAKDHDIGFALIRPNPRIWRVFVLTGLNDHFRTDSSLHNAWSRPYAGLVNEPTSSRERQNGSRARPAGATPCAPCWPSEAAEKSASPQIEAPAPRRARQSTTSPQDRGARVRLLRGGRRPSSACGCRASQASIPSGRFVEVGVSPRSRSFCPQQRVEQRDDQPHHAGDDQDDADGANAHRRQVTVHRKAQDGANRDQHY
jgi:anti-anti-sigma factor